MSAEPMDGWQSADWQPAPAQPYAPRGDKVPLLGGPLDGRTAHVADARESLWLVQKADGGFEAASSADRPAVPADARIVGRYALDDAAPALRWHPAI